MTSGCFSGGRNSSKKGSPLKGKNLLRIIELVEVPECYDTCFSILIFFSKDQTE